MSETNDSEFEHSGIVNTKVKNELVRRFGKLRVWTYSYVNYEGDKYFYDGLTYVEAMRRYHQEVHAHDDRHVSIQVI